MKSPLQSPGVCPGCRERLTPQQTNPQVDRPHFQCTACGTVYAMDVHFKLNRCENPSGHLQHLAPRADVIL